jgi:hypothetical protein
VEGKEDRRGKANETYEGTGLVVCARLRVRRGCGEDRIGVEAESRWWKMLYLRQFPEIAMCDTRVGT